MGMVALKCPSCGANIELDDSREFGFCNYCGTKVMQDKIVIEHQGSIKIDDSENVTQYLQNARSCRKREDWEGAKNYYDLVLKNEPTNYYAAVYSAYASAKTSLISSDTLKRKAAFKILINSIRTIKEQFDFDNESEHHLKIAEISNDLIDLYGSEFVYNQTKNGYGIVVKSDKDETDLLFYNVAQAFILALIFADHKIPDSEKNKRVPYYEMKLGHLIYMLESGRSDPDKMRNMIASYYEKIKAIEPEYKSSIVEEALSKNSGGCYVATAVYGSYDCPQVWTLRRYRDNQLASTWYGRAFIHTYYAISPTIVKWFGETQWFKHIWKGKLDRMVENLQLKGYESTPYDDLDW